MISQILNLLAWYLLLAALGWLVFPIAYRFLRALPDRGYAFARPLGLLIWGFIFWILSSFGVLANERGGLLTALLLVLFVSVWAWRQIPHGELFAWLRAKRSTIVAVEVVFAISFLFMAFVRASAPAIFHTEQPMEMAFINAILHSPGMPPHDPWLSGYSISYYYFGYLMVAMQAKLLEVASTVAFNLGFISTFAMAATAAYGLLHDLLALYQPRSGRNLHWLAGLAPLFVLLLGNAEGLLEIMHAEHLFWRTDAAGAQTSGFWAWMDIKDLVNPPTAQPQLKPRLYRTGTWWWWRASRVINDRAFSGGEQELIDEIPAFSYVLGDLHPHVLSMPFVTLAMALALNFYLGGVERKQPLPLLGLEIQESDLVFCILVVGALAFLNIWDFPIYIILIAGAYVLRRAQLAGWHWGLVGEFLTAAFTLGLGGVLLYLPFYLSFTSQAGGILPNLLNPTRGAQFWVMFITLLIPIVSYLVFLWARARQPGRLLRSIIFGFAFVAALWIFSLVLAWTIVNVLPSLVNLLLASQISPFAKIASGLINFKEAVIPGMGAPDFTSLMGESIQRRLSAAGGWITIALLLAFLFGLMFRTEQRARKPQPESTGKAQHFVLLLTLVGALLVTAPEFIYLRDQFSTRMNTVFKFYFQAWQMWAVVASFAIVVLLHELRRIGRVLLTALLSLTVLAGLVYPLYAFSDIVHRPAGQSLNLDGGQYLSQESRDAISWLQQSPPGILVEAVGGSYSAFARYATFSGQPGVMGWPGHEGQWRNGNVDYGRIADIETLYTTGDWQSAQSILEKYDIQYVIVGDLERSAYPVIESKFQQHLQLGFQNGQVSIYLVY